MSTIELTQSNFDEIIAKNELVFIDFWAEWCAPCKAFAKPYEEASEKYPGIIFGKVDIEKEIQLAADFNVRSIPLLMVLKQGIVIFFESGALPPSALDDLVTQAKNLDMAEVKKKIQEQESKGK